MLGAHVFPLYLNGLTAIVVIRTIRPDDNSYYNEKHATYESLIRKIPEV